MCNVCVNEYTKLLRKKVTCPYCNYDACSTCIQQYLLSTPETPHCMSCRKAWSRNFLVDSFTAKFVNSTYKTHRENVLFELEKSLMPSTQDEVVRVIEHRKINREIIGLQATIGVLDGELRHIHNETLEQKEMSCNLRRQIFDLQMKIEVLQFKMSTNSRRQTEKKQFIRACPAENCKGFLSTQWKCGICDRYTCKECNELKDENHTCKPENIETAKLLRSDSKPCPSCAAIIFKIDGCDQMFCTACHTAFSWRTGRIETGTVHNPHYYEYMRSRGALNRQVGDVQCGGLPDVYTLSRKITDVNERARITNFHREILHFQLVEMNRYTNINNMNQHRNLEYRVKYMLNEMTEADFKQKIQQVDKDLNKRLEIGQVATTFIQVMSDLLNRLNTDRNVTAFNNECEEAIAYFNNLFYNIAKSYNCTVPYITRNKYIQMSNLRVIETLRAA